MKSFLYLIFLFASHFAFAQSDSLKHDSANIQHKVPEIENSKAKQELSNIDKKKPSDTKSNTEKSIVAQNINIVQEINTVLNYKVNRIWREDLYCLVCIKNYNSQRAA